MKKWRIFGLMLMIIGVIIICSALYMRYSTERKQQKMIENFEKSMQQIGNGENSGGGDTSATGDASDDPSRPGTVNDKAIAILEIPKINITVAVVEGTSSEALKYAVGHFEGTGMPGQKGNFCVAGHRSYTYSEYFNRADELDKGDIIKVRTQKGEFTYEIYEKKTVEPSEVSVLNPTDDATITLVTCTPIRIATHRLIIKGRLK